MRYCIKAFALFLASLDSTHRNCKALGNFRNLKFEFSRKKSGIAAQHCSVFYFTDDQNGRFLPKLFCKHNKADATVSGFIGFILEAFNAMGRR